MAFQHFDACTYIFLLLIPRRLLSFTSYGQTNPKITIFESYIYIGAYWSEVIAFSLYISSVAIINTFGNDAKTL